MFFFICSAACNSHYARNLGLSIFDVESKDQILVRAKSPDYFAFVFWPRRMDFPVNISVLESDNNIYNHEIEDDHAFRINGIDSNITFQNSTSVFVWIIPKSICPDYSLLYSTNHAISDTFVTSSHTENLCLFYSSIDTSVHFELALNDHISSPSFSIFTNESVNNGMPDNICSNTTCHENIVEPFFVQLKNLQKTTVVKVNYDLTIRQKGTSLCDRSDFVVLSKNSVTVDHFEFLRSDVDCSNRIQAHDLPGMGILFFTVVMAVFCILALQKVLSKCFSPDNHHLNNILQAEENTEKKTNINVTNDEETLVGENVLEEI